MAKRPRPCTKQFLDAKDFVTKVAPTRDPVTIYFVTSFNLFLNVFELFEKELMSAAMALSFFFLIAGAPCLRVYIFECPGDVATI